MLAEVIKGFFSYWFGATQVAVRFGRSGTCLEPGQMYLADSSRAQLVPFTLRPEVSGALGGGFVQLLHVSMM